MGDLGMNKFSTFVKLKLFIKVKTLANIWKLYKYRMQIYCRISFT